MILTGSPSARTNRSPLAEWWRSVDHTLLAILICLIGTGIILSMAASPAASAKLRVGDPFYFLYRHSFFALLGLSGAIILSFLSPQNARRIGVVTLIGTILALIAVVVMGHEVKGAQRWIKFAGFSLQPSEFAKPAFIVLAAWMFSIRPREPNVPAVLVIFLFYLVLLGLFIVQPDFGQSFLLTLCFAAVFFFAGLSLSWMLFMMSSTVGLAVVAYFALPHVKTRVQRFMGTNGEESYQIQQALEAIGNGGFFGRGPGEGAVKYKLPDGHTDFIFAVTVEEFGFLLSTLLLLLLAGFVVRCFRSALKLNDYFSQLAVAGLATMIGMQTIINVYVNLNMAPSKGMTLPFISYGGSSLIALCFTAGLILAFTRRRPGAYGYGD